VNRKETRQKQKKEAGAPGTKIAISASAIDVEAVVGEVAGFAAKTRVAVSAAAKSAEARIVPKSSAESLVKVKAF
jgi:hypothetical protein